MSQAARRTRVQRLADSVLPGRTAGGYANLIEARLRKLAAAGSTGMLPLSGPGEGGIFFRGGQVVYAESTRTPAPHRRAVALAGENQLDHLAGLLALTEPTIDAITELLSSESRYAKFQPSDYPPATPMSPLPIDAVLAEVERRRQVLRQLAAVVTADSPVARHAPRELPSFQVTAAQWALLVCTGEGSTPRALAMALGRSVFATTIEVYRLLALGTLVVRGRPQAIASGLMSFTRALSDAGGGHA